LGAGLRGEALSRLALGFCLRAPGLAVFRFLSAIGFFRNLGWIFQNLGWIFQNLGWIFQTQRPMETTFMKLILAVYF
jgi:hypothetical protein